MSFFPSSLIAIHFGFVWFLLASLSLQGRASNNRHRRLSPSEAKEEGLGGGFECDAQIAVKRAAAGSASAGGRVVLRGERELEVWTPAPEAAAGSASGALLADPSQVAGWDQFEENRVRFGVETAEAFPEELYTTVLNRSQVPPDVREKAERIAREIEMENSFQDKETLLEDDVRRLGLGLSLRHLSWQNERLRDLRFEIFGAGRRGESLQRSAESFGRWCWKRRLFEERCCRARPWRETRLIVAFAFSLPATTPNGRARRHSRRSRGFSGRGLRRPQKCWRRTRRRRIFAR